MSDYLSFVRLAMCVCALSAVTMAWGKDPDMHRVMTVARDTAQARAEKAGAEIAKVEAELRTMEDKKSAAYQTLVARRHKIVLYRKYHEAYADYVQARFDLEEMTTTIAAQLQRGRYASDEQNTRLQALEGRIEKSMASMREVNTEYSALNDGMPLEYPHRQYLVQLQKSADAKERRN